MKRNHFAASAAAAILPLSAVPLAFVVTIAATVDVVLNQYMQMAKNHVFVFVVIIVSVVLVSSLYTVAIALQMLLEAVLGINAVMIVFVVSVIVVGMGDVTITVVLGIHALDVCVVRPALVASIV
eukprot:TRINITY_DN14895_c0_g1_i1.p2 TRINITY_DN14895_c0_g1~~TRINITY_DN14895_c0_g1_i1.p2  ORF type:complete len:125 (+),score=9.26 TRINITY_DN14895_c0_g1_i1:172-546(+)